MKIGIFSDIHIHNWKRFAKPSTLYLGINSRAEACLEVLFQIGTIAKEEPLDCILFCGDFFESRGNVSIPLVVASKIILSEILDICPIFAVSGNHDLVGASSESISALNMFDSLNSENGFTILDNRIVGYRELSIAGIPNGSSLSRIDDEDKKGKILIMHHHVTGARMSSSSSMMVKSDISIEQIEEYMERFGYSYCFIGDIHTRQKLEDNIWYVGSTLQHDFGETQNKGILILDTDKSSIEFREIPSPKFFSIGEDEIDSIDNFNYFEVRASSSDSFHSLVNKLKALWNVIVIAPPLETKETVITDVSLITSPIEALKSWLESKNYENIQEILSIGEKYL